MEVSGRKVLNEDKNSCCKPCEESDLYTLADGFCRECSEHMCKTCFDTHKKWKLNRSHTLTNSDVKATEKEQTEDFAKCDQHFSELVKFYCPQHEQVGCGDCIILEHKTCKVEYIRDKARSFKGSSEFKSLVQGVNTHLREAKETSNFIHKNKKQAEDINEKLIQDVNMFKEEIFSHVNKLTNIILKQGDNIKVKDLKTLDALEEENEDLMIELSQMSELFESHVDQPQKLFVSSILQKPKLNKLREQLDSVQSKNKIEVYKFQRNNILDCNQLGNIRRIKPRNESDVQEVVKPKVVAPMPQVPVAKNHQVSVSMKPQPLLDRHRICRNLAVDGDFLSYVDNGRGDVGLYVDNNYADFRNTRYFEVEILSMGQRGTIAIGVVPRDYPENQQPGWGNFSIGYHADDGLLYDQSGTGKKFGPKCSVGDRIGCKIESRYTYMDARFWCVEFTRNGKKIGSKQLNSPCVLHPAIGMHSVGENVKVKLDAEDAIVKRQL